MTFGVAASKPPTTTTNTALRTGSSDYVVTLQEASRLLSLSERTLARLIASEEITAIAVSARRRGILASEIVRYCDAKALLAKRPNRPGNIKKAAPSES
jgi:hypothetical protein